MGRHEKDWLLQELDDQIEHRIFMDSLDELQEEIWWALRDVDFETGVATHYEAVKGGNEPIFAGIWFDLAIKEEANNA